MPNTERPLIAIVDDDESIRRALNRLIRSLGMTVEAHGNSTEFVDQIEGVPSYQPDCVILDLEMPGMTGSEVQARLRRARGAIPVIFITAHDDPKAREKALANGAVAFLHKPFDVALLLRTLHSALGRNGTEQVAADLARDNEQAAS